MNVRRSMGICDADPVSARSGTPDASLRALLLGPSWRQYQRRDTEPLGTRSRASRPRSNRQALTSGDGQASSIHRRWHATIGVLRSEVEDQYRRQASSITARASVSGHADDVRGRPYAGQIHARSSRRRRRTPRLLSMVVRLGAPVRSCARAADVSWDAVRLSVGW
jgi:hypothetical protein